MKQLNVLDLPRHWSNFDRNYETVLCLSWVFTQQDLLVSLPLEARQKILKDMGVLCLSILNY